MSDNKTLANLFMRFQQNIIDAIEQYERPQHQFKKESWDFSETGGGITAVIENGKLIEKGGVNFSHIKGTHLPPAASARNPQLAGADFEVMGVSVVMHPHNPFVPTTHLNVRLFQAQTKDDETIWWIGGGFDLTPYYAFTEDCVFWHNAAQTACALFDETLYPRFKKNCDDYFYLPHRKEARGIGGIFYDDFNDLGFDQSLKFSHAVVDQFIKAYTHIIERRHTMTYSDDQKQFQLYRRGRYAEFNLAYDRGTRFGLQTDARTESILMSMPPEVIWKYNWQPEPNSPEAELTDKYLPARDWLAEDVLL